ncbi:MAG: EAL domain-containing protein [Pseudomonadota bacterium]
MALQSTSDADIASPAHGAMVADLAFFTGMAVFACAVAAAANQHFDGSLTTAAALGCALLVASIFLHVVLRRVQAGPVKVRRHRVRARRSSEQTQDLKNSRRNAPKAVEPAEQRKPPNLEHKPGGPGPQLELGVADAAKFWALRPGDRVDGPELPPANTQQRPGAKLGAPASPASPATPTVSASGESVADVETINAILRRMAQDITAGRARARAEEPEEDMAVAAHDGAASADRGDDTQHVKTAAAPKTGHAEVMSEAPDLTEALARAVDGSPPDHPEAIVDASVEGGRSSEVPDPVLADVDPGDEAARLPDTVVALAEALAAERIGVFFEPINSLDNEAAQHYEMTLRLRLADGEEMAREAYSAAASGTAVLPLIDTIALVHARRLVWRQMGADAEGRLFTGVSGEAVLSRQFAEDFEKMVARDVGFPRRIVLSLPQSDARLFTDPHLRALGRMSNGGIVFALDGVTDLDMDFEALAAAGFRFVKLDADVFLNGLPVGGTRVPADDICQHLRRSGLVAIVGHIQGQAELERLRHCGVTLGQGPLFGTPALVKAEVSRAS